MDRLGTGDTARRDRADELAKRRKTYTPNTLALTRKESVMWPNDLPKAFELFPLTPAPQSEAFLAGKLTALDAPGGGETQLFGTAEGLRELGVSARLWRPWEESLKEAKCLHLFGSLPEHLPLVEAARRACLPVLLSTITWFDWRSYWREAGGAVRRCRAVAGFAARAAWPKLPFLATATLSRGRHAPAQLECRSRSTDSLLPSPTSESPHRSQWGRSSLRRR